ASVSGGSLLSGSLIGSAVGLVIGAGTGLYQAHAAAETRAQARLLTLSKLTLRIATNMLIIIGIDTNRVPIPKIVSTPPINSVYADKAALKCGHRIPQPAKRRANPSRLWSLAHPVSMKK